MEIPQRVVELARAAALGDSTAVRELEYLKAWVQPAWARPEGPPEEAEDFLATELAAMQATSREERVFEAAARVLAGFDLNAKTRQWLGDGRTLAQAHDAVIFEAISWARHLVEHVEELEKRDAEERG